MRRILVLAFICFFGHVSGQYELNTYTEDDGLISGDVTSTLWQSPDGYVWFVGAGRLCRFDGREFEYFGDPESVGGIYGQILGPAYFINKGIIFPGDGCYYLFDGIRFQRFPSRDNHTPALAGLNIASVDRFYRGFVYNQDINAGIICSLLPNGAVQVDTIYLPQPPAQVYLAPDNHHVYSFANQSHIYELNRRGHLDSIAIPVFLIAKTDFNSQYHRVHRINEHEVLLHHFHQDTLVYINLKNNKARFFPRNFDLKTIMNDLSLWGNFMASPALFWTDSQNFVFYHAGEFFTRDTSYSSDFLYYHRPFLIIDQAHILFRTPDSRFEIRDMVRNEVVMTGIPITSEAILLNGGEILMDGEASIHMLVPSEINYYNAARVVEDNGFGSEFWGYFGRDEVLFGSTMKFVGASFGETDKYVRVSGNQASLLPGYAVQVQRDKKNGHFVYNKSLPDFLFRTRGLNSGIFYAINDTDFAELTPAPGIKDAYPKNFVVLDDSLYGSNGEKWFSIDLDQGIYAPTKRAILVDYCDELINGKLIRYHKYSHGQDSCGIQIQHKDTPILAEYVVNTTKVPAMLAIPDNQIAFISESIPKVLYVFDSTGTVISNIELDSKIADGILVDLGVSAPDGNLYYPISGGVCRIDCRNDFKLDYVLVPEFYFLETMSLKVDDLNRLFLLNASGLYCTSLINLARGLPLEIKKVLNNPGENYNAIYVANNNDIILAGAYRIQNSIRIPHDFDQRQMIIPPKLRLKSLKVNNLYECGERLDFNLGVHDLRAEYNHDENDLDFKFSAVDFRDPRLLQFRHKISHRHETWVYSSSPEIILHDLDPDEYMLEVQSVYSGVPSDTFVYSFIIYPPWWATTWFNILQALFFALLLFITYFVRKSKSKRLMSVLTMITIIVVFEAILALLSEYLDYFSHGIPIIRFLLNVIMALCLKPIDQWVERKMLAR